MTSVAVIGNCQAGGLARAMRALLPGADVHAFVAPQLRRTTAAEFASHLDTVRGADLVFAASPQNRLADLLGPLSTERLRPLGVTPSPVPIVALPGAFPDLVSAEAEGLVGPFGIRLRHWQSAIAAAAFMEGLSEARAVRLFNAYTYGSLGYFEFDGPLAALVARADVLGFDLRFLGDALTVRRAHIPVHPTMDVFLEVARQALGLAGITAEQVPVPADEDPTLDAFPVYPELAARAGGKAPGPFRFRRCDQPSTVFTFLDLPEFVAATFAGLSAFGGALAVPAIDRARAFIRQRVAPVRAAA